jgi:hypothetical protein
MSTPAGAVRRSIPTRMEQEPRDDGKPERRRILVIVAFLALTLALALVLAFFYAMPSADL